MLIHTGLLAHGVEGLLFVYTCSNIRLYPECVRRMDYLGGGGAHIGWTNFGGKPQKAINVFLYRLQAGVTPL